MNTPEQTVYFPDEDLLPQNIDAEQAVLGSILINPHAVEQVSFLTPADFYLINHREIFGAMLSLHEQDRPADIIMVTTALATSGALDRIGGAAYLASLSQSAPSSLNIEHYAGIVHDLAVHRRLVEAGARIAALGRDDRIDATRALHQAEEMVADLAQRDAQRGFSQVSSSLAEMRQHVDAVKDNPGDVTGVPTGLIDLDRLLSGFHKSDLIVLAARPAMGKCLAGDTKMYDPLTGAMMTIRDLYEKGRSRESVTVHTLNQTGRIEVTAPSAFVDDGIKPVYRVRTRLGREIKTTLTHPFLVEGEWTRLVDLKPGMRIAVPRALPLGGAESLPRHVLTIMAFLIGDGGLTGCTMRWSKNDPVMVAEMRRACTAIGVDMRLEKDEDKSDTYRLVTSRFERNPVTDLMKEHGLFGKKSKEKHMPNCVYRLPKDDLAFFLNRLFAGDGSVEFSKRSQRISYSSASKELIYGVQHLLLRFGINGRIRSRMTMCAGKPFHSYELAIMDSRDVLTFLDEIGIFARSKKTQKARSDAAGRERQYTRDTLPMSIWHRIDDARRERGMTWADVQRALGKPSTHNCHPFRRNPRRETVAHLSSALQSPELKAWSETDIYWDEIASIDYVGEEHVYDLTVPGNHNFIAEDFFVHNTSCALNIAHHVAMHAKLPVAIFSVEMSSEQLVQRLIALDAEVDSQLLRTGKDSKGFVMRDFEYRKILSSIERLRFAPIFIDDTPSIPLTELRGKAKKLCRQQEIALIIVDYLQLVQGPQREGRVQEVGAVAEGLKHVARSLDVPLLSLAQLSRAPEQRPNHEPMLSDLRESGSVEQAADVVMFIYRDKVYNPETERPNVADLIVAKHRNGPTGRVHTVFAEEMMRFGNLAGGVREDAGTVSF